VDAKNDLFRIGGAVLGAVAIAAGGLFVPAAIADATTAETAADELPPFAVEDFNYPGADRILEERGFLLKRGDGHIVLADCGSEGDLMEFSVRRLGLVCFRVTGNEGYLALEMPSVYGIRTGDSTATHLELTVDNEEQTYDIPANTPAAIGESDDPEGRPHTLVEIRTTN
jgi:hypothetical protein